MRKINKKLYGLIITILICLIYIFFISKVALLFFDMKDIFVSNLLITPFSSSVACYLFQSLKLDEYYYDNRKRIFVFGSYFYDILIGVQWGGGWMLIQGYLFLTK